jgi:Mrp family chromosome partitioning ATPase
MSAASPDIGLQFRQALRVLRRQAWIILLCALVAAGVAYELAHRQSLKYEATAQLLIQTNSQDLALPNTPALFTDATRGRATALQLITSHEVARLVAQQLHPKSFDTQISATASGDSDVVSVTARAPTAVEAAQLANGYATEYIVFRREQMQARYLAEAQLLNQKLAAAKTAGHEQSLSVLRQQAVRLHLAADTQTGDAQLVQAASMPSHPVSRNEVRDGLLGGGFGLLLGLGLAFLRDKISDRVTREDELAELAPGVPVIGYVPSGRSRRWTDAIGEAFNNLSASLDPGNPTPARHTLLVTSAMAEDGKSTTAVNLALASRQRGQSVLLVDADLRRRQRPGSSSLNGQSPGLAAILTGQHRPGEAVQTATFEPTRGSGSGPRVALSGELQLIPHGGPADRPQRLFTPRALESLVRDVRVMADTVIIDGPPLGIVADMLPIAKIVDGVLVVVRLEHTRPRPLKRLLEQLATAGLTPVGLVVIGAETGEYYR